MKRQVMYFIDLGANIIIRTWTNVCEARKRDSCSGDIQLLENPTESRNIIAGLEKEK